MMLEIGYFEVAYNPRDAYKHVGRRELQCIRLCVVKRITHPQICPPYDPQNLWIFHFTWQKRFADMIKLKKELCNEDIILGYLCELKVITNIFMR